MIAQVRPFPQRSAAITMPSAAHLWGIVLAGGRSPGEPRHDNVAPFTRRPRRAARAAEPTRLRSTLERASRLIAPEHLVAVFSRDDAPAYEAELASTPAVRRVVQPRHRGSAAETFLPLLKIARIDPEAVAAILPADHVASTDGRVIDTIAKALTATTLRPDLTVLIGTDGRRPEPTYGWVEPGEPVDGLEALAVRAVRRFVHDRPAARGGGADAALLSAPAIVGKAHTLLALGQRYLPEVLETLEPLDGALDAPEQRLLCEAIYECMPYASVARELLERGDHFAVLPGPDALWRECATGAALAS